MAIDRTKIKKVEVACFFFKEQMNMHLKTAETMRELESSPLENLLASVLKKEPAEFKVASKKLRRTLEAEGDMFLAYEASNGKEGFAVTSEGIYAKSDGVQSVVDFDTLSHTESLRFEDNDILADGKLLAVFSGSEETKEKIIGLFDEIIEILCGKTVD